MLFSGALSRRTPATAVLLLGGTSGRKLEISEERKLQRPRSGLALGLDVRASMIDWGGR